MSQCQMTNVIPRFTRSQHVTILLCHFLGVHRLCPTTIYHASRPSTSRLAHLLTSSTHLGNCLSRRTRWSQPPPPSMNPRKRQAPDTQSTCRRHKQPRLALKGYGGGTPSPSEKEGLLSRWNRFRMDFVALSADTLTVIFSSLSLIASSTNFVGLSSISEITLREPSDPQEPDSLDSSSSSTPQQISSPDVTLLCNLSTDSHHSTPSRTVVPPCNATTLQGKLMVQSTTPRPNGPILADINGRLRDLPESPPETDFACQTQSTQLVDRKAALEYIQISNQVTPTRAINRTLHSSVPSRGAPLKSERDTREPEYPHRQPCTYGSPEDADLPTSRTSHSLLKDSPFPPADSSLTSWSSVKDDVSDRPKSLHLGSSPSFGSSQRFRFSTTSSNSHPTPNSHIPPSRKSSVILRKRNRPHIHEKVVSIWTINCSMLFLLSPA